MLRVPRGARAALLLAGLAGGLGTAERAAAEELGPWALCGAAFWIPPLPAGVPDPGPEGSIRLSADEADLVEGGVSVFTGNVVVRDGEWILASERGRYDAPGERVEAEGNLRFWEGEGHFTAERGQLEFATDELELFDATFLDRESHGRGRAGRFTRSGPELIRIRDGEYTTCNPGEPDWLLEAGRLKLDRVTDIGTARDVKVRFKGVPIFYTPFLTFPLSDRRKSGFLTPSLRLSGEAGSEVIVPYYFNLAPNYDATLSGRLTSERGPILGGEFRYLQPWGSGELNAEWLPRDLEREESRSLVTYRHRGIFRQHWTADVHYDRVSDPDYFTELGTSLAVASTTHLRQSGVVTYSVPNLWASGRLENFQTIDRSIPGPSRPFKRLPQLHAIASSPRVFAGVHPTLEAEYVYFERDDSVTGHRLDLQPRLTYSLRRAGWFFVPRLTVRHTAYFLDGRAPDAPDTPSRTLPVLSADGGLLFERPLSLGGRRFLHTLEPRLFYVFIPFEDQGELPLFDTGQFTFNFDQLFREHRFSGADRVGDTNQLTVALTTRLLEQASGRELLRASLGQIRFFRDRRVALGDAAPETRSGSDVVADLSAGLWGGWRLRGGLIWDADAGEARKSAVALRYQPDRQRVANLAYRFVEDAVEQTDFSFRWPWDEQLSFVGGANYSVAASRLLEGFGGLEFESCCWALRAIARRFLTDVDGEYNTSLFLQLELKGLSGVGEKAERFLERSIPGYQNSF